MSGLPGCIIPAKMHFVGKLCSSSRMVKASLCSGTNTSTSPASTRLGAEDKKTRAQVSQIPRILELCPQLRAGSEITGILTATDFA